MATRLIRVCRDGTAIAVSSTPVAGVVVSKRRASHVEPCNGALRAAFRLIRRHVADESRIAAWTRRWCCNWRVDLGLSNGPILAPFSDRSAAIAVEVAWLEKNVIARGA